MTFDFVRSALGDAAVAIVGMPLDRSSSFIPGTRFGPEVARIGSVNIESFSPYLKSDAARLPVCDCGDLSFGSVQPEAVFEEIRQAVRGHLRAGRRVLAVGGEHSITPAIVAELVRDYSDLCVIQFDAHSDLRDEFLGDRWSHATAIRRVLDLVPRSRVFQLGIRSFSRAEEMTETNLFPFAVLEPVEAVRREIGNRPVYLTLDVDVLDPSVLPDVQTPQPGGVSYHELVRALTALSTLNVVGADVVEFCPRGPHPTAGAPVVAELVREMAIIIGSTKQEAAD